MCVAPLESKKRNRFLPELPHYHHNYSEWVAWLVCILSSLHHLALNISTWTCQGTYGPSVELPQYLKMKMTYKGWCIIFQFVPKCKARKKRDHDSEQMIMVIMLQYCTCTGEQANVISLPHSFVFIRPVFLALFADPNFSQNVYEYSMYASLQPFMPPAPCRHTRTYLGGGEWQTGVEDEGERLRAPWVGGVCAWVLSQQEQPVIRVWEQCGGRGGLKATYRSRPGSHNQSGELPSGSCAAAPPNHLPVDDKRMLSDIQTKLASHGFPQRGGKLKATIRHDVAWNAKTWYPLRDEGSGTRISGGTGKWDSFQPSSGPVNTLFRWQWLLVERCWAPSN